MTDQVRPEADGLGEHGSGWSPDGLVAAFAAGQVRGVRVWSPAPAVAEVVAAAQDVDWRCVTLDTAGIVGKRDLIAAFGRAFPLPAYLGHNWDALEESLGDVAPGRFAGMVVVWTGWTDYCDADPAGFATVLAICRTAARAWSHRVVGSAVTLRKPARGLTDAQHAAVATIPRLRPS
jgi:hypothetical protein